MSVGSDKAEKEARARLRMCLDKEVTHLRLGSWSRLPESGVTITPVGHPRDMHGAVCTCCPRRGGDRG